MARIINFPRTKEDLRKIADRYWLRTDKGVHLVAFYPFRDYYGGYLVYEISLLGKIRRFKQWIGNSMARKLGVKEVFVYGKRST
ncbi:MAG: hypothetical protein WBB37_07395 [bacterium]